MKALLVWIGVRLMILSILIAAGVIGLGYYLRPSFEETYQLTYCLVKRDRTAFKKSFNQMLIAHHYFADKFPFEIRPK